MGGSGQLYPPKWFTCCSLPDLAYFSSRGLGLHGFHGFCGSTWVPATWNVSRKEGARGKPFLSISVAVRLLYLLGGATVMQDTDMTLGHLPISPPPPQKRKKIKIVLLERKKIYF